MLFWLCCIWQIALSPTFRAQKPSFANAATSLTCLDFRRYLNAEIVKDGLFDALIPLASTPQPQASFASGIFLPPKTPAVPCSLENATGLHWRSCRCCRQTSDPCHRILGHCYCCKHLIVRACHVFYLVFCLSIPAHHSSASLRGVRPEIAVACWTLGGDLTIPSLGASLCTWAAWRTSHGKAPNRCTVSTPGLLSTPHSSTTPILYPCTWWPHLSCQYRRWSLASAVRKNLHH